jgi:hypothetical protein
MITHKQMEEATAYYNYCIKEDIIRDGEYEFLTDDEFVKVMRELMERGDAYADTMRKGE